VTDTERFIWLESHKGQWWGWSIEYDGRDITIAQYTSEYHEDGFEAPTLREAIDKAIEGSKNERKAN
jgi:hypothetical protein